MVPFKISPESVRQLRNVLKRSPEARPEHAVRIFISGLSPNGPEWSLALDTYSPAADECCEFEDLRVIVDRALLNEVGGLDVDYEVFCEDGAESESDENDAGGFVITPLDPDVQSLYGSCGGGCESCGGGCENCGGGCGNCGGGCHHHDDSDVPD